MMLCGVVDTMPELHRTGNHIGNNIYQVKSIPISDLLKDLNIQRVDLFSIDVEGGELQVLETFDWNFTIINIMLN